MGEEGKAPVVAEAHLVDTFRKTQPPPLIARASLQAPIASAHKTMYAMLLTQVYRPPAEDVRQ